MGRMAGVICNLLGLVLACQGQHAVCFTENKGQVTDSRGKARNDILFYADYQGGRMYFFSDRISIVTRQQESRCQKSIVQGLRLDKLLAPAESQVALAGDAPMAAYQNYYLPHCDQGIVKVKQYKKLVYKNYQPGRDLVFFGDGNGQIRSALLGPHENEKRTEQLLSACSTWSTYYGGAALDEAWGITGDGNNNTYVVGYTLSNDFPVSPGAFQDTVSGFYDAVVIKMDSCGNRVWTTFVGSSGNDFGEKICMNKNRIAVLGHTTGNDLPVGNGAWQQTNNGSYDAFLFRFNENGTRLWATYFGGSGGELGLAVASDTSGNIFFGGSTSSNNLPVQNAFQLMPNGALDAYVAKFDSTGQRIWCTYYGGSGSDDVHGMAADNTGSIAVAGGTFSNDLNVSAGAYQPQNNGFSDCYLLKLDASGNRVFSTYFGGNGAEDFNGVCTDAQGKIYLAGVTASSDLPVTPGAFQQNHAGGDDIVITCFDAAGSLDWCTYYGGLANEQGYAIATDQQGHVFVLAISDGNPPVIGTPLQAGNAGGTDAFIVKLSYSGQVLWSTFYGGSLDEAATQLHVDSAMHLYITGHTGSADFPVSSGAYQPATNGPEDMYIARLDGSFDTTTVTLSMRQIEAGIYPNPSGDNFIFFSPRAGIVAITICDQLGKIMDEVSACCGKERFLYNGSQLPAGIYFAKVATTSGSATVKLIKTR